MADSSYIGRFAPTPSGPLHFGSVIAGLASFLDAKRQNGLWFVKIDDLDTPRIAQGSIDSILYALDSLGLYWDGDIYYQSDYLDDYRAALKDLQDQGLLYRCNCTRKSITGRTYPGTCRAKNIKIDERHALRIISPDYPVVFVDKIQHQQVFEIKNLSGDFIVKRSDGLIAYHLSVVVDDANQKITHIVRGADLLESTASQVYLQQCLGYPSPQYSHVPVAVNADGRKLSKQHGTEAALLNHKPEELIYLGLEFLGMNPEPEMKQAGLPEIFSWAITNWDISRVPDRQEILTTTV